MLYPSCADTTGLKRASAAANVSTACAVRFIVWIASARKLCELGKFEAVQGKGMQSRLVQSKLIDDREAQKPDIVPNASRVVYCRYKPGMLCASRAMTNCFLCDGEGEKSSGGMSRIAPRARRENWTSLTHSTSEDVHRRSFGTPPATWHGNKSCHD